MEHPILHPLAGIARPSAEHIRERCSSDAQKVLTDAARIAAARSLEPSDEVLVSAADILRALVVHGGIDRFFERANTVRGRLSRWKERIQPACAARSDMEAVTFHASVLRAAAGVLAASPSSPVEAWSLAGVVGFDARGTNVHPPRV